MLSSWAEFHSWSKKAQSTSNVRSSSASICKKVIFANAKKAYISITKAKTALSSTKGKTWFYSKIVIQQAIWNTYERRCKRSWLRRGCQAIRQMLRHRDRVTRWLTALMQAFASISNRTVLKSRWKPHPWRVRTLTNSQCLISAKSLNKACASTESLTLRHARLVPDNHHSKSTRQRQAECYQPLTAATTPSKFTNRRYFPSRQTVKRI